MSNSLISRREAIRRTVLFSTSLMAANWTSSIRATTATTRFSDDGMHLLALGDFGTGNANQAAVAKQMSAFAQKLDKPLTSVLALGDNFYGKLETERFGRHFEEMYSREHLNCPFYACLGNHDYGPLLRLRAGRGEGTDAIGLRGTESDLPVENAQPLVRGRTAEYGKAPGQNHFSGWEHVYLGTDAATEA